MECAGSAPLAPLRRQATRRDYEPTRRPLTLLGSLARSYDCRPGPCRTGEPSYPQKCAEPGAPVGRSSSSRTSHYPPRARTSSRWLTKADPARRSPGSRIPEEYAVDIPTTPILLLRFPDGDVEYRSTRGELPVGTRVRARGSEWRIARYQGTCAYLEALVNPSGAPGSPPATPIGLGRRAADSLRPLTRPRRSRRLAR